MTEHEQLRRLFDNLGITYRLRQTMREKGDYQDAIQTGSVEFLFHKDTGRFLRHTDGDYVEERK